MTEERHLHFKRILLLSPSFVILSWQSMSTPNFSVAQLLRIMVATCSASTHREPDPVPASLPSEPIYNIT